MHTRRAGRVVTRPLNCGVRRHVKLIDLLGQRLKDDDVVEFLESYEMQVIYEFDRLHENSPDRYTSDCISAGFQLQFNEQQVLGSIFCYVVPTDGFAPVDPALVGVPLYHSLAAAESDARKAGVKVTRKDGVEFMGRVTSWIRFERQEHWWHFEYSKGALAMGHTDAAALTMLCQSPNKQLQRTVTRRRGDGASAPFHYALAPRFTRQCAAAELRR